MLSFILVPRAPRFFNYTKQKKDASERETRMSFVALKFKELHKTAQAEQCFWRTLSIFKFTGLQ